MTPDKKNIVFITGRTGSGKTELAKLLSAKFDVPVTSFGNVVRAQAAARGMATDDKKVLQRLGQEMVEFQLNHFCQLVLTSFTQDSTWVLIEGLRHEKVLAAMRAALPVAGMYVLHVFASKEARFERLEASRGWSHERCQSYEDDPTENETDTTLAKIADYSIDNSYSLASALESAASWLNAKMDANV